VRLPGRGQTPKPPKPVRDASGLTDSALAEAIEQRQRWLVDRQRETPAPADRERVLQTARGVTDETKRLAA
jgi:hypothetical protein